MRRPSPRRYAAPSRDTLALRERISHRRAVTLDELTTFARIVESRSLTAAARATRQSVPTVSRQLRALEEELGVVLARRTTRALTVTPEGHDLYEHAARILREVDAARGLARAERLRASLTVSASVTLGQSLVVPRLSAILREHPGLRVALRLEDHLSDFVSDGVDVAIRAGVDAPDSTSVVAVALWRFHRTPVASPAYLAARGAPHDVASLAQHACLVQLGAEGPIQRWRLVRGDDEQVVDVRGPLASTAPMALREAALSGVGVAFLPTWLVRDDVAHDRLREVLPGWASKRVTTWGIYRREARVNPAIRVFLRALGAEGDTPRTPMT
jgi:DNA-binding transcriptional LysR family regulator